jgi:hypothetical protein
VAKGALVSVFRPSAESTIRRIRDSHCIGAFWAGAVSSEFHQRILSMEPGQTFGASPSRNKPRRKRPKAGFQPIEDAFREASR